jgi:hypothetical protein
MSQFSEAKQVLQNRPGRAALMGIGGNHPAQKNGKSG